MIPASPARCCASSRLSFGSVIYVLGDRLKKYFVFLFVFLCFTSCPWNIEILKGRAGQGAGQQGSPLSDSCPRNNKAPWHNYKNVCCRFWKIAPTWAHQHKHTHMHMHITTYTHIYIHMCMAWYIRAFVVAVGAFN